MLTWIQAMDWRLLDGVRSALVCPFLDAAMPVVTHLGDAGAIWILAGLVLLAAKKYRKNGIMLLCGLLVGVLIGNVALKNLAARARPCWERPDAALLIAVPTDYSFPSGHTLASVIGAAMLTRANRRFGCAAIPLAALIALSRLYLFVHFPSDVLASVALGLAIAAAMERLFRMRAIREAMGRIG